MFGLVSITKHYASSLTVKVVAMRVRRLPTVACFPLRRFSTLSHKRHVFWGKSYWTKNVCFDFLYNFFSETFSFWEELSEIWSKLVRNGLRVKYRYSCQIWMELEFSWQIFEKDANIKFHDNLSSGSPVVPCGQMERRTDGWTDGWTDRHDEATSRFSPFCESVPKPASQYSIGKFG